MSSWPGTVTVFTGSSMGADPRCAEAAAGLGAALGAAGVRLVYGGGRVGLMGVVADAALAAGGEVVGIIPQSLVDAETAHTGLSTLEVVPDMHVRKQRMAELAEVFVALPGGIGTLEELFEVWTWLQLGFHSKPVALYDVALSGDLAFWGPLRAQIDQMVERGFLAASTRDSLVVADSADALRDGLARWSPPAVKWT